MKVTFIISSLLFSLASFAGLEGNYSLLKGGEKCPNGNLSFKSDKDQRVMIFGASHSWTLNSSDKGELEEKAEGGCHYKTSYEKSENIITIKTLRNSCPDKKENSEITESLELKKDQLIYKNEVAEKKSVHKCIYKKI